MITAMHHVQITIPGGAEELARAFYCGVLGLPEVEKPASLRGRGGLWVRVGDRQVHIGAEDGVDRTKTKAHLAYQVTDVAHWRRVMEANGLRVLESVPVEGFDRFETRDPFGNRIEFIQPIRESR
jgi:catechol 2,3-dioxygenase-like lactoylglutathione lyase family enzyme